MNITKVQSHWSVKEGENERKLWKEVDILVIKPTLSFKYMFFAMQCLLKCSHLPVWRFDSLRACDVAVKVMTFCKDTCVWLQREQVWNLMLSGVPFSIIFGRSQVACTINQSPELLQRASFTERRQWQGVAKQALTCKSFPWMSFRTRKKTNPRKETTKNYSGLTEINLKSIF